MKELKDPNFNTMVGSQVKITKGVHKGKICTMKETDNLGNIVVDINGRNIYIGPDWELI